jgi:sarcosine oxidase subunit gamma
MVDRVSALAALPPNTADAARVSLSEVRPTAILQIQAWPDTLGTVEAVVTQALGIEEPPRAGHATWFHHGSIAAIGAGRYLVSTTDREVAATLVTAFSSADATVTDLSHGRTVLRLEGDAAAELLARCVPLDFDLSVFPVDRIAQTAIHHVDVLVHRLTETSFELWVLRSFAESTAEWLIDAGAELGLAFHI